MHAQDQHEIDTVSKSAGKSPSCSSEEMSLPRNHLRWFSAMAAYGTWVCLLTFYQEALGRDDVVPGVVAGIQTHGELLHWNPYIHSIVTAGAFTPEGEFLVSSAAASSVIMATQGTSRLSRPKHRASAATACRTRARFL